MYNNHIIIGLGGTGGKIILAFRKILWEECRNLEARFKDEQTQKLSEPVANIAYLYADSNEGDLNGTNGEWEILGKSLKLDEPEKVLLSDESGGSALMNKRQFPSVSGWIGDTKILEPLVRDARALKGCNQIRRFGRYVFSQNAEKFLGKIRDAKKKLLKNSNKDARTFHICCTLGCGTGSGSIVDAVAQIRKEHGNEKDNPIFLYCLVNSKIDADCNAGYFFPNQFAVLSELNALCLTTWHPHDVATKSHDEPRLNDLKDLFEACFLISPNTQDNQVAGKDEQEEMIASYIYQKIVPLREDLPEKLQKAESQEDVKVNASPDRCSKFASLGIKRYRIPEEEIREKLSFTFCRQAVLQTLFNNLKVGYAGSERHFVATEWTSRPENKERWCLTDSHLMLSTDFSRDGGGKVWPSITDEWTAALNKKMGSLIKFKNKAKEDRQTWLTEMNGFSELYFARNFRDTGVNTFYKNAHDTLPKYAQAIRDKIETHLFEQWRLGDHSLNENDKILAEIVRDLTKRKEGFDKRVTDSRKSEENAAGRILEAVTKWNKIGMFSDFFANARENILGAVTLGLIDKNVAQTEEVACGFAKDLLQQIIDQLGESKRRLAEVTKMFTDLMGIYQDRIDKRISDHPESELAKLKGGLCLANKDKIDKTISVLEGESEIQKEQCTEVREAIASVLGMDPNEKTFTTFAHNMNPIKLDKLIYSTCDKAADIYHTNYFNRQRDVQKILGRNIVEKLYEESHGDVNVIAPNIANLVASAAAYMQINKAERIEESCKVNMPQKRLVVFIPEAGGDANVVNFHTELAKAFKDSFKMSDPGSEIIIAENKNNPKEILLISVDFFFELRFILPLVFLRAQYEALLKQDELKYIHLVHLENHRHPIEGLRRPEGIKALPSLYPEEVTDDDYFIYVILGMVIEFIKPEENQEGTNVLQYAKRNAKGTPLVGSKLIDLKSLDPLEAGKQLSRDDYKTIKAEIDSELKQSYCRPDKKELLKAKLSDLLDAKFEERKRKSADPIFWEFKQGVEAIGSIINDIGQ